MSKLAFLALLATATPMSALACPEASAPLIAASHQGLGIDVGNSDFTIYEGGAYKVVSRDPKAMRAFEKTGCLTDKQLASVTAAIKAARWELKTNAITCHARTLQHTVWTMGKHTYDAVSCPSASIDETTQKLFALVNDVENQVRASTPG